MGESYMSLCRRPRSIRVGHLYVAFQEFLTLTTPVLIGEEEEGWPERKPTVVVVAPEPPLKPKKGKFYLFFCS